MKKVVFLTAIIFLLPVLLSAQFDLIKLSDAFNYLKTQPNLINGKTLILIQALQRADVPQSKVDLLNGTSAEWSFMYKSDVKTDHLAYIYIIFRIAGVDSTEIYTDATTDYQLIPTMDTNFIDSDSIGVKIQNNPEFMNYYNMHINDITGRVMQIKYYTDYSATLWEIVEALTLSDYADCAFSGATGDVVVCDITTFVINEAIQKALKTYPNPASDNIRIEAPISGNSNIEIYDYLGNIVKSDKIYFNNFADIDVSGLPAGVYMLKILNGNDIVTKKISIMR